MKKFIALIFLIFISQAIFAQDNFDLYIYHELDGQQLSSNTISTNDIGETFEVTRIRYYLSRFSIVHDGGQETLVPDDTIALVSALLNGVAPWHHKIALGNYPITNVEKIRFHIGVYDPVNNEDPLQWPSNHPLAPQNPSMHWGWTTGYRFLVYEGKAGVNFMQPLELHTLSVNGVDNYTLVEVNVNAQDYNGNKAIVIDANYTEGLRTIPVQDGIIAHGTNTYDKTAIENFANYVFSASAKSVSLVETYNSSFSIYPNPTQGSIQINGELSSIESIQLIDESGRILKTWNPNSKLNLDDVKNGLYFLEFIQQGQIHSVSRIIKQ